MALLASDHRLLADLAGIDDRGLELAEAIVHRQRQHEERHRSVDPQTNRALLALSRIRDLTRR